MLRLDPQPVLDAMSIALAHYCHFQLIQLRRHVQLPAVALTFATFIEINSTESYLLSPCDDRYVLKSLTPGLCSCTTELPLSRAKRELV